MLAASFHSLLSRITWYIWWDYKNRNDPPLMAQVCEPYGKLAWGVCPPP